MTTIAMGAGMLPIAIGLGTDPSFRAPMAIVVIGGLITSTFLSLLVIPVLYEVVDDVIQRYVNSTAGNYSFSYSVRNVGDAFSGSWNDRVWLADNADLLFWQSRVPGAIRPVSCAIPNACAASQVAARSTSTGVMFA